jgi:hypothetical protein
MSANASPLTRWLVTAVVAGAIALLAAFLPSPLLLLQALEQPAVVVVPALPHLSTPDVQALSAYDEIAARPIFNEGRKADPDAPRASAAPAHARTSGGELSEFRLVGIVADSAIQRAIVEREGAASQRVAPGDEIAGWRVESIDRAGIVVTKDARSLRISIPKSQPRRTTP